MFYELRLGEKFISVHKTFAETIFEMLRKVVPYYAEADESDTGLLDGLREVLEWEDDGEPRGAFAGASFDNPFDEWRIIPLGIRRK